MNSPCTTIALQRLHYATIYGIMDSMSAPTKTSTIRLDEGTDQQLATLAADAGVSRNKLLTSLITERYAATQARQQASANLDDIADHRANLIERLRDA